MSALTYGTCEECGKALPPEEHDGRELWLCPEGTCGVERFLATPSPIEKLVAAELARVEAIAAAFEPKIPAASDRKPLTADEILALSRVEFVRPKPEPVDEQAEYESTMARRAAFPGGW